MQLAARGNVQVLSARRGPGLIWETVGARRGLSLLAVKRRPLEYVNRVFMDYRLMQTVSCNSLECQADALTAKRDRRSVVNTKDAAIRPLDRVEARAHQSLNMVILAHGVGGMDGGGTSCAMRRCNALGEGAHDAGRPSRQGRVVVAERTIVG